MLCVLLYITYYYLLSLTDILINNRLSAERIFLYAANPSRGSAIAKIVGANVMKYNNIFETRVTMYVYEEIINNEKLTNIINTIHENVKYLPGHKIPENVASISNILSRFYSQPTFDCQINSFFFRIHIFTGLINNSS